MGKVVFEGCTTYSDGKLTPYTTALKQVEYFFGGIFLLGVGILHYFAMGCKQPGVAGSPRYPFPPFVVNLPGFFWLVTMWDDHQVYILSWIRFDSISHTGRLDVASSGTFCMPTPAFQAGKQPTKRCDASKTNQTD